MIPHFAVVTLVDDGVSIVHTLAAVLSYPEYKTMVGNFFLGKKTLWSSLLASGRLLFFKKKIPMVVYYGVVVYWYFQ